MQGLKITILLADDHRIVRNALEAWFTTQPDLEIIGGAADGTEAVALAEEHQPDVVVLDIDMPGVFAFDAARRIRAANPATRILFLSGYCNDTYIEHALSAGAHGYVIKGESPAVLAEAIRAVASGQTYFSPQVQERIVVGPEGARLAAESRGDMATLTPRELEVLRYLAQGLAKKQVARILSLSVGTVNNHAANLMKKLHIHDRVELTRFAIRAGIVSAS